MVDEESESTLMGTDDSGGDGGFLG